MSHIENQHALREIDHNIVSGDFIKARLVMDYFQDIDRSEREAILLRLTEAPDEFAIPMLSYLLIRHNQMALDFPGLSKTILEKAKRRPDVVVEGLSGDTPEKTYYVRIVRRLELRETGSLLITRLSRSDDKAFQLEILITLGSFSDPKAIDAISEYLHADDLELSLTAVLALGRIATENATRQLAEIFGKIPELDTLILDVFAEIQDDLSLKKLNEALSSRSASTRNHARSWLIAIGDAVLPPLIDNLSDSDDNRRILSLNVLQVIGDDKASWAIRQLINTQPQNPNVRFAAYEALADLSRRKGDYVLAGGLTDPNDNVRLAAAKAVAQNLDDTLIAGVQNMIDDPGEKTEDIVRAIIDAQAGTLFTGLIKRNNFSQLACAYLGEKAHQSVRDYFVGLLMEEDLTELADTVLRLASEGKKRMKGRVCAVDDSRMVLNIYRSVMTDLGYEIILFSNPGKAASWLREERPDFFCTDLNMPGMTGIELIQEVRKIYNKSELPIILVTTQNETRDNTAALKAGANEIMSKPFDAEMISAIFAKIISNA